MTTKAELRKTLAARRKHAVRENAGERLADVFLEHGPKIPNGTIVAGFWPIRSEIDVRVLMERLQSAGAQLALPRAPDRLGQINFHHYDGGTPPGADAWGIPAPMPDAPVLRPQVVLVPLLGFDAKGGRIGYGAGIYDQALNRLRASGLVLAVGLAFSCQEVDEVPVEPHDAVLDWVITEEGVRVRPLYSVDG